MDDIESFNWMELFRSLKPASYQSYFNKLKYQLIVYILVWTIDICVFIYVWMCIYMCVALKYLVWYITKAPMCFVI